MQINIVGYVRDTVCAHCNRNLTHGIRLSDGRTVGATCLDQQLTEPKRYQGKPYRLGSEKIIRAAKVAEFYPQQQWARFGVSETTLQFSLSAQPA